MSRLISALSRIRIPYQFEKLQAAFSSAKSSYNKLNGMTLSSFLSSWQSAGHEFFRSYATDSDRPNRNKERFRFEEPNRNDPKEFSKCLAKNITHPIPQCTTHTFFTFPCCSKPPSPPKREKPVEPTFKSMWGDAPIGCNQVCRDPPHEIRHDIKYLKPESEKRPSRTWCDWSYICIIEEDKCPAPKKEEEPVPQERNCPTTVGRGACKKIIPCCEPEPPRARGQINKAPTRFQPKVKSMPPCPQFLNIEPLENKPDPIQLKRHCPPQLREIQTIRCCQKRCTPYPSFSECRRRCLNKKRDPGECERRRSGGCKVFTRNVLAEP